MLSNRNKKTFIIFLGVLVALLIVLSSQSPEPVEKENIENSANNELATPNNNNLKQLIAKTLIR